MVQVWEEKHQDVNSDYPWVSETLKKAFLKNLLFLL
jgi:hypothetical protein